MAAELTDNDVFGKNDLAPQAPVGLMTDDDVFGKAAAPAPGEMPGIISSTVHGLFDSGKNVAQTVGANTSPEVARPEAAPLEWSDLKHPIAQLAPKLAYSTSKSAPMLAGGIMGTLSGGALGAMVPGAGETGTSEVAGGLIGGPVGAAVGTWAQDYGPTLKAELAATPNDPNGAFERTWKKTAIDMAGSGISWAAFNAINPFKDTIKNYALKNLAVQAGVVQPAVAEAQNTAQNLVDGKPAFNNAGQTYAGAVAGVLPLGLAVHTGKALLARGKAKPGNKPPPPPPAEEGTIEPDAAGPQGGGEGDTGGNGPNGGGPAAPASPGQQLLNRHRLTDETNPTNEPVVPPALAPPEPKPEFPPGDSRNDPASVTVAPTEAAPAPASDGTAVGSFHNYFPPGDNKTYQRQGDWIDAQVAAGQPHVTNAMDALSTADKTLNEAVGVDQFGRIGELNSGNDWQWPGLTEVKKQRSLLGGALTRLSNIAQAYEGKYKGAKAKSAADYKEALLDVSNQAAEARTAVSNYLAGPRVITEEPAWMQKPGVIPLNKTMEAREGTIAVPPAPEEGIEAPSPPLSHVEGEYEPNSEDHANARNVLDYLKGGLPKYVGEDFAGWLKDHGGINVKGPDGKVTQEGQVISKILKDTNPQLRKILTNGKYNRPEDVLRRAQQDGWFGPHVESSDRTMETGSYPGDSMSDLYELLERHARGEKIMKPGADYSDDIAHFNALQEDTDRAGISASDDEATQHNKLAQHYARERVLAEQDAPQEHEESEGDYQGEPHGGEEVDDEGLLQGFMGYTGHSAQQLAAAREAEGHGKMATKRAQAEPGGMFDQGSGEPDSGDLFAQPEDKDGHDSLRAPVTLNDKGGAPLVRAMLDRGLSFDSILQHIGQNAGDADLRVLAKRLAKALGDKTKIRNMNAEELADPEHESDPAWYDPNTNTIVVHPDLGEGLTHAVLHEGVHAATSHAIFAESPAGREIIRLYKQYKALAGKTEAGDAYGLDSPHEFAAEALSNGDFKKTLEGLTDAAAKSAEGAAKPSLWARFKAAIARILGQPGKMPLDKILEATRGLGDTMARAAEEGRAEREGGTEGKPTLSINGGAGGNGPLVPKNGFSVMDDGSKPGPVRRLFHWMRGVEDALQRLKGGNNADAVGVLQFIKALPDEMKDRNLLARLYHAGEEEKLPPERRTIKLTPREQELKERWVDPIRDAANRIFNRLKAAGVKIDYEGYMHRMVMGKNPAYDPHEGPREQGAFGRGLGQKVASMFGRKIFAAERADGSFEIIHGKYKPGDKIKLEDGSDAKVREATTKEIEARTDTRYYKNAIATSLDNLIRLRRVERNVNFLEKLKKDPVFASLSVKPGSPQEVPSDYRASSLPQLRGWMLNPRIAKMMDNYYDVGSDGLIKAMNRELTRQIFINPISAMIGGHGLNVLAHWYVGRGFDNFLPHTWAGSAKNALRAANDVWKLTPRYRKMLEEGNALMYAPTITKNMMGAMNDLMHGDMARDPETWGSIAKKLGTSPLALYEGMSQFSSKALWMMNDVLMLQRVYDLEDKGLSARAAITKAEHEIPNYRLPTEAWDPEALDNTRAPQTIKNIYAKGSVGFPSGIGNPSILQFGRYHYGLLHAIAHTVENSVSRNVPPEERAAALGQVFAMVVGVSVLQPLMNKAAQWLTDNPKAYVRSAGPFAQINSLRGWLRGPETARENDKRDLYSFAQSLFPIAPATKMVGELATDRDWFTNKAIWNPTGTPGEVAGENAAWMAKQPYLGEQAAQIAGGRKTRGEIEASWLGINTPTDKENALQTKYKTKDYAANRKAWERTKRGVSNAIQPAIDVLNNIAGGGQ